ncbi:MAG: endonuclease III domain-containing protein [Kiritimatiellae bacterium]|nr:endonuclease III domain-containing protein [Kiritimatiellia bacterium]
MNPPLHAAYRALFERFGPQHWWPAQSRFEMMVGAILTQNTAWTNVEKAIAELRKRRALTPRALQAAPLATLAQWIRPAGYYNVKSTRLRTFTDWIIRDFGGSLTRLFREPTESLRAKLLAVNGVGPETADSILLYAGERPVFVVDAYTRRILERHGWAEGGESYDAIASLFTRALPREMSLFNEYHALIVQLGKEYCRAWPRCEECPLRCLLPEKGPILRKHKKK